MAAKRKAISFPELDNMAPKGKGAILRTAAEVQAEQDALAALEEEDVVVEEIELPGDKKTSKQANQETSFLENKEAGKQGNQQEPSSPPLPRVDGSKPEQHQYKKVTYKLRTDAVDALEDIKLTLRRNYGIKVSMEAIVQEIILAAYEDLTQNQETSIVVEKFSSKPGNK